MEFTHRDPDFVFWISPAGRLLDPGNSHRRNPPERFEYILQDEPDYGGFLRGRVASTLDQQLIVVYCREEALVAHGAKLDQFLRCIDSLPIAVGVDALVISDNADLYGTLADLYEWKDSVTASRI